MNNGQIGKNYCYFPTLVTEGSCLTASAQYSFYSCGDHSSVDTCPSSEPISESNPVPVNDNTRWPYYALACQWSPFDVCQTEAACTAQGLCNDWEMNPCPGSPPGTCASGACVQSWKLDPNHGQRQWCQSPMRQSPLGCIDATVQSEQQCIQKQQNDEEGSTWTWHTKAYTEEECLAHGSQCSSADYQFGYSAKPQEVCTQCQGRYSSVYQYTRGAIIPSTQQSTSWQARAWITTNQMVQTISYSKLNHLHDAAISKVMAQQKMNFFHAKYGSYLPVIKAIQCACGDDVSKEVTAEPVTGCFVAQPENDVTCTMSRSGSQNVTCRGPHGSQTLSSEQIPAGQVIQLNQQYIPAGILVAATLNFLEGGETTTPNNLVALNSPTKRKILKTLKTHNWQESIPSYATPWFDRKQSKIQKGMVFAVGNSATFAIVTNALGVVVGQIISGAVPSDSSGMTYPRELCIDLSLVINQDTVSYPVADFASVYNISVNLADGFVVGQPLGLADVLNTAAQSCATIEEPGIYIAILRRADYLTYRGVGADDSSSSSSTLTWWAIFLIVFFGVCCCCMCLAFYGLAQQQQQQEQEQEQEKERRKRNRYDYDQKSIELYSFPTKEIGGHHVVLKPAKSNMKQHSQNKSQSKSTQSPTVTRSKPPSLL